MNGIMREVAEGKRVEIRNFGVFSVSLRKAHLTRSPKTAKPVPKASARLPKFRAGKPLQALAPIALKQTALSPVALDAASASPIATSF